MRRVLSAIGLFFLAPLIAEFLLGDVPITAVFALLVLAPAYGGGALLIREVCRRRGWGWPSIVTLALAYGVLEEGALTQSLFNPAYAGKHLLAWGYLPALGMGAAWTVFVVTLHMVWSISVPIAFMELLSRRGRMPWLGSVGLAITAVLFAIGLVVMAATTYAQYAFVASVGQLVGVAVVVVALVVLAVVLGHRRAGSAHLAGRVPSAWVLGLLSLVVTSGVTGAWYLAKDIMSPWLYVALVLVAYVVGIRLVARWARLSGWVTAHKLALVAGALLTYAWEGFVTSHMVVPTTPTISAVSHVVFALGAGALLAAATVRVWRGARSAPQPDGPVVGTQESPARTASL